MNLWVLVFWDTVCGVTDSDELAEKWNERGNWSASYLAIRMKLNEIITDPSDSTPWVPE